MVKPLQVAPPVTDTAAGFPITIASNKYGCQYRIATKQAHAVMENYLKTFEPSEEVATLFTKVLADIFSSNNGERLNQKVEIEKQIELQENRMARIQENANIELALWTF